MAPGAEAAAALSHFGTVFGSPPGVPGGGMTGIAPPFRGGAALAKRARLFLPRDPKLELAQRRGEKCDHHLIPILHQSELTI
jgi:hypothetical protein